MLLPNLQILDFRNHGFHGNGIHALVGYEQNVLGKVKVFRREGAANVIALIPTKGDEFFDFIDDEVERAFAVYRFTNGVVYFLATV